MRHMMAVTCKDKIAEVIDGTIKQTIRQGERIHVGDELVLHGFKGKVYRSKWTWRKEVTVKEIIPIWVDDEDIEIPGKGKWPWESMFADGLAKADGVKPPTGIHLKEVLEKLNGKFSKTRKEKYQIIRW